MSETNWTELLHIVLLVLKIVGVVGAFFGLSEQLHQREKPTGWRRFAPVLLLFFAVSAEIVDAELKHIESAKQAILNEELLRPVRTVTAALELSIPETELKSDAPAYYARVHSLVTRDSTRAVGYFEFEKKEKDPYPSSKDAPALNPYPTSEDAFVLEVLKAYYSSSLRFYPRDSSRPSGDRPSKRNRLLWSPDVWIELSPGTEYVYQWGATGAKSTPAFPPQGRRYMLNSAGLNFMDPPVTVNLNGIASSRKIRSISDLRGGEMVLTVCPEVESEVDADAVHTPRAQALSKIIHLRNLSLALEGIGTFNGLRYAREFTHTVESDCIVSSYRFPDDAEKLAKLFE